MQAELACHVPAAGDSNAAEAGQALKLCLGFCTQKAGKIGGLSQNPNFGKGKSPLKYYKVLVQGAKFQGSPALPKAMLGSAGHPPGLYQGWPALHASMAGQQH